MDDADRLADVERTANWCRKQLEIYASNTEAAMEKHMASMAAWTEASGKLDDAQAEIAALKAQVEKLTKAVGAAQAPDATIANAAAAVKS